MKIIIGFSFGSRGDWPNGSTQDVAKLIAKVVEGEKRYDYVIIAQWEVAQALELHHILCDHVVWSRPCGRGYLRTTDIAEAAISYIVDNALEGAEELVVAAHSDHVKRCMASLRTGWLPKPTPLTGVRMTYDPESNQFWVRARWRFLVWNFLATLATTSLSGEV